MIQNRRVVALIPARGGSKSIPLKNIKMMNGRPLLAWTIETALQTKEIDRVIVSTDHEQIARAARQYGAEVMIRPDRFAQDDSLPIDVIRYCMEQLQAEKEAADIIVYLEPTCPLRKPEDISGCLALLADPRNGFNTVATFKKADLHPYRAWKLVGDKPGMFMDGAVPWLPRQQLSDAYQLNGAVYALTLESISGSGISVLSDRCGAVVMPGSRSVDIDDEIDFLLAELLMQRGDSHG
ncbi:cytidylyltransferase domain-containing protein [Paenibacillus harenae]|uniref:acylneuraminate cytidylyltransferase family protein n=1 Tax=Paenibacillus harenae TaxID=306543 RepID=UPI000423FC52|nr:acylneuraminate cytidylyltransferase family protein [Paenibacillus harenae]